MGEGRYLLQAGLVATAFAFLFGSVLFAAAKMTLEQPQNLVKATKREQADIQKTGDLEIEIEKLWMRYRTRNVLCWSEEDLRNSWQKKPGKLV